MTTTSADLRLQRAKTLVRVLDDRFLDPLLGVVFPGLGDLVTAGMGLYLLVVAGRAGMPPVVLARMLLNLAIDAAVGAIPIAGDGFDLWFRANRRNLALIEGRHHSGQATAGDWLVVGGAALLFVAALALPVIGVALLAQTIF